MEDHHYLHHDNGSDDQVMRRGPWTLEEDTLLLNYIARHGEGRWNFLARSAGLKRNGKSCRLRWLNYLKPDIKRGNLTHQEQLLILELHSKWGNRWSKIAQHLPGRTDNEVKNYWRTRVQKQAKLLNLESNSQSFLDAVRSSALWTPGGGGGGGRGFLHIMAPADHNNSNNPQTTPSSSSSISYSTSHHLTPIPNSNSQTQNQALIPQNPISTHEDDEIMKITQDDLTLVSDQCNNYSYGNLCPTTSTDHPASLLLSSSDQPADHHHHHHNYLFNNYQPACLIPNYQCTGDYCSNILANSSSYYDHHMAADYHQVTDHVPLVSPMLETIDDLHPFYCSTASWTSYHQNISMPDHSTEWTTTDDHATNAFWKMDDYIWQFDN